MQRSVAIYLTVLSLCALAPLAASAHTISAKQSFEVSGWLPYWRIASSTKDVMPHLNELTEINPFGYSVKSDGSLSDTFHANQSVWQNLFGAARGQHVLVIPTVMWSDGQAIDTVLRNPTLRAAHVKAIVKMLRDNGYDGVDIDYEGKLAETEPFFSLFLKQLSQALANNQRLDCTIESRTPIDSRYTNPPKTDTTPHANDFVAIGQYCDRVRIMTYDQGTVDQRLDAANAPSLYAPVADPLWVEKVIKLAEVDINPNKIVIGIPTYGYEYQVTPADSSRTYDRLWAFNPQYALDLAQQYLLTPTRNSAGELSFSYTPKTKSKPKKVPATAAVSATSSQQDGLLATTLPPTVPNASRFVSWSDAQAIQDKVLLAHKLGVRGVAVFKLDGGEDQGVWNALQASSAVSINIRR